jgi:hypothetical protein
MKEFKEILDRVLEPIKKIPAAFEKIGSDIENAFETAGREIETGVKTALNDAIVTPFSDMTAGIDALIEDFIRIVCFLNNVPMRFANVGAGFDSIFDGVVQEFVALGYAIELGYNSISSLVFHVSVFLKSYLDCGTKMITNLGDCFFFYILEVIGQILYLPIRIILWILITFLSVNLYESEKDTWNSIYKFNDTLYPYINFHIAHYPESIREKCYSCVRLRNEVIKFKGDQVDKTFNKDIPAIFKRKRVEFERGRKQFNEFGAYPKARDPRFVI